MLSRIPNRIPNPTILGSFQSCSLLRYEWLITLGSELLMGELNWPGQPNWAGAAPGRAGGRGVGGPGALRGGPQCLSSRAGHPPWPILPLSLLLPLLLPPQGGKNQPGRKLRSRPLSCRILYFPLVLGSGRVAGPPGCACACGGELCGRTCLLPPPAWPSAGPSTTSLALSCAGQLQPLPRVLAGHLSGSQVGGCRLPACVALGRHPPHHPPHWGS